MATSKKAGMFYFGINEKWVLEKFTPKEISLFFKEAKYLFANSEHTEKTILYLEQHPELREVIEKW